MTGITAEYVKKFLETCWLCSKPLGVYCLEWENLEYSLTVLPKQDNFCSLVQKTVI